MLVRYAGLNLIEALDRGVDGVISGSAVSHAYQTIIERYRAGSREAAKEHHEALLPLVTHIFQGVEQLIHYEKRMLADQGFIDNPTCREPAFDPDDRFDALFEQHYKRC